MYNKIFLIERGTATFSRLVRVQSCYLHQNQKKTCMWMEVKNCESTLFSQCIFFWVILYLSSVGGVEAVGRKLLLEIFSFIERQGMLLYRGS